MAIKLKRPDTLTRPVKLTIPGDPPSVGTVTVTYKFLTLSEYTAWSQNVRHEDGTQKTNAEWLSEIVVKIDGLKDDEDKPIEYTPEVLAALCDTYMMSGSELRAGFDSALTESRAKN